MPAVGFEVVRDNTDEVSFAAAWAPTMTVSSALANGAPHLFISLLNSRPEGTDGTNRVEVETRLGTTRIGLNSFATTYGQFNTGDSALGNVAQCMAVVTGDGSSTINLRRQNTNGNVSTGLHRVGGQELGIVNLDDIGPQNTAWWYSETANSEAASVTPTSATWLRAGGTTTDDTDAAYDTAVAGEVQFSAPTTGEYLIVAYVESFFSAAAADGDQIIKRLRQVDDPAGATPSTATIGSGEVWCRNNFQAGTGGGPSEDQRQSDVVVDYRTLTSGTTYRFQLEVSSNGGSNGSCSRLRIFVLDLSALSDYVAIANGGDINASSGEDDGANDLVFDFGGTAHDALVLASGNVNNSGGNWGHYVLREDPAGTPVNYPDADGRMVAWGATSAAPDNTMPAMIGYEGITGSHTIRAVGSADAGGNNYRWGRNPANSAAGRLVMVALMMDTPAGGSTLDGDWDATATEGASASSSRRTPGAWTASATEAASAQSEQQHDGAWQSTATEAASSASEQRHAGAWGSTATEAAANDANVRRAAAWPSTATEAASAGSEQRQPGAWSSTATEQASGDVGQEGTLPGAWSSTATEAASGGASRQIPLAPDPILVTESASGDRSVVAAGAWQASASEASSAAANQAHAGEWSSTATETASGDAGQEAAANVGWSATTTEAASANVSARQPGPWSAAASEAAASPEGVPAWLAALRTRAPVGSLEQAGPDDGPVISVEQTGPDDGQVRSA